LCATEQSETKRSYENENESINFNHLIALMCPI